MKLLIAIIVLIALGLAALVVHFERMCDRRAYNTEYTIRRQKAFHAADQERQRLQDSVFAALGDDFSAEQYAEAVWYYPSISMYQFLDTTAIMDSVKARREREVWW